MAQKNDQGPVSHELAQADALTLEIEQRNVFKRQGARMLGWPIHNANRLSRSALLITETELSVIAALAMIGLKSTPKKG